MSSEVLKRDKAAPAVRPAAGVPEDRALVVTPSRCTGCRTCELACAVSHGRQMMPARSRVRAFSFSERENIPILCLQCDDAACVRVCPVEALVRNEATGAVEVAEDRCILCNLCIPACPFGNIYIDPGTSRIVKCDLCRGNPICAQFCPTGALSFEPTGR
jgi:carbon-monoxide dehydrogenase iron sulfur subunit